MQNLITILVLTLFYIGCEGDCVSRKIEQSKWITTHDTLLKDTLLNYAIVEHKMEFNPGDKTVDHLISIRNQNKHFSGKFAIKVNFLQGSKNLKEYTVADKSIATDYVNISADSIHTFSIVRQARYYDNFNCSIEILQLPVTMTEIVKREELNRDSVYVNNCEVNVQSLILENNTIKSLYNQKVIHLKDIHCYKVRIGDTLTQVIDGINAEYNRSFSIAQIAKYNKIRFIEDVGYFLIKVGEEICFPNDILN